MFKTTRDAFFRQLRRAFSTDDGREIAVHALDGLLNQRPPRLVPASAPYPELPVAAVEDGGAHAVFITARFRTGSTLLWNVFRHVTRCRAYYEPLNERRWFDPAHRGGRTDPTHRGVDDYWREYEGLSDLAPFHQESWTDRRLYMDESTWDPNLRDYCARLIRHAAPDLAVLQCNRIDFRLPWIRSHFPRATILHLYRHPRDQWCSSLLKVDQVPRDMRLEDFEPFDHFYLRRWTRDLQRHFPLLADQWNQSAYRSFYLIWRLSYIFGTMYAHRSVSFERLAQEPEQTLREILDFVQLESDITPLSRLIGDAPLGRWGRFAEDGWFRDHEAACETQLAALTS